MYLCVCRLHEQLHESDDAAQYYIIYIQDIFSCGVSCICQHLNCILQRVFNGAMKHHLFKG